MAVDLDRSIELGHSVHMACPRISRAWLFTWIALLIVVTGVSVILVWSLGLPWLGLAGPLIGFVGSVPAWIGHISPQNSHNPKFLEQEEGAPAIHGPKSDPTNPTSGVSRETSIPPAQPVAAGKASGTSEYKSQRRPGSPQFSDLVYALGRFLGNPASVYQVSELAGLNRGDLEDGFVNAPTRWYAALKLAVESELEEALCREAVRASPSRELRTAAAAYLR